MSIEQMRGMISKVYGPTAFKWILRCRKMKDEQVIAVYYRMKEAGKFDKRRKEVKDIQKKNEQYHQMTLWEYGVDI